MSVRERIEDAKLLWNAGRKEGAFVQILIAVAATARKRYPKPPKGVKPVPDGQRPRPGEYANDGNSFKTFMLDEMDKITGGMKYNVAFPFRGNDKTRWRIFSTRTFAATWSTKGRRHPRSPLQNQ